MDEAGRRSTRRRGAALEAALLQAAAEVLRETGYAGMTMDLVAQRAGTNKNALYRRWPSRAALGVAAYQYLAAPLVPVPDTGALRGDALELLGRANTTWSSPEGAILRELLAAAGDDPELLTHLRDKAGASAMNDAWDTVLDRAIARGEAPPAAAHPRVASLPMMLLRAEYLLQGTSEVADEIITEIVDEVLLPLVHGRATATERT